MNMPAMSTEHASSAMAIPGFSGGLSPLSGVLPGMGAMSDVAFTRDTALDVGGLDGQPGPVPISNVDLDGNAHTHSLPKVHTTFTVYRQPGVRDPNFGNGMLIFSHADERLTKSSARVSHMKSLSALNHYLFSQDESNERFGNDKTATRLLRAWHFAGFQVVSPDDLFCNESYADITLSHAGISPFVLNIWLAAYPNVAELDHLWLLVKKCESHDKRKFWAFVPHVRTNNSKPPASTLVAADGSVGAAIYVGQVFAIYNETSASASTFATSASLVAFPATLPVEDDALELPCVQILRPVC